MNLNISETSTRIKERIKECNDCSFLTLLHGVRLVTHYLVILANAAKFWQSSRGSRSEFKPKRWNLFDMIIKMIFIYDFDLRSIRTGRMGISCRDSLPLLPHRNQM